MDRFPSDVRICLGIAVLRIVCSNRGATSEPECPSNHGIAVSHPSPGASCVCMKRFVKSLGRSCRVLNRELWAGRGPHGSICESHACEDAVEVGASFNVRCHPDVFE